MPYPDDLLGQANRLASLDPRKPKQANLRRAVSAAYYAVFHNLVDAAASRFLISDGRLALRQLLGRAFVHSEMRDACRSFSGRNLPQSIASAGLESRPLPAELVRLARTFVDLQEARHEADYDLSRRFTRQEARDLIQRARQALQDWQAVRGSVPADTFLVALLAFNRVRRR